jgi:tetratricopeptide (TPR) repeat protein
MAMRRMMLGALTACLVGLTTPAAVPAGETSFKTEIEQLNRLTGQDPMQGELHQLLNSPDKAKGLVKAALPLAEKKEGLSYNAALVLGLAAADQKDLKASETFLRVCVSEGVMVQSTRKLAQAYGTLIELLYEAKRYADCARVCKEVLDLKTDTATPRLVLRAYTDDSGDTDFIEDNGFHTAKRLQPMVARYLVRAQAKQGKYDQALALADKLAKGEADWRGQHLKGWVLREAGRYDEAAKVYESVLVQIGRDPDLDQEERDEVSERLRQELSNLYVDLKQIDRAVEQLEMLVKKRPDEAGYYNDLGYILADHDMRLDEAEQMIRKALDLDRERRKKAPGYDPKTDHDSGAYLDSLGWVLFKKKQYPEAKKYLELAVEDKNAQHLEIYDHLGDVLLAQGDHDGALRAWQKGLEVAGEDRRDQERRVQVEKKIAKVKNQSASK